MPVSFDAIQLGEQYSRQDLAKKWGYGGFEAISRGVVTPRDDNKIILFVTREKRAGDTQYEDELVGDVLLWEGPNDHFAEDRILRHLFTPDEVHLFYREQHREEFTYMGQISIFCCERKTENPSCFVFRLASSKL